jgi:hypothetical protein
MLRPASNELAGVVIAAAVPLVSIGAIAAADTRWLHAPSLALRTESVAWLLLVQAAVIAIWAPLMGLFTLARVRALRAGEPPQSALARMRAGSWQLGWRMMVRATAATASSAAIALALQSSIDASALLKSHAMLWTVALTFAAMGAACAAMLAEPLDGAATATGAAVLAATALFAAGPALDRVPPRLLDAALVVNPVVATAVGANLDLFRMGLFYQLSPLAHRQVDYPAAAVALAAYALMAVGMLLLAAARLDRRRPTVTIERMAT